ncbi:dTDP-4-dehydrorhamnose reductase [Verrucomicrobiota bacterium]
MKILVVGCRGQLGHECVRVLGEGHDVRGLDVPELDITRDDCASVMATDPPEAIVNCAGYTDLDRCETQRSAAWGVNVEGVRRLAGVAERHGAVLLHVSTDYVFDGERPQPHPYTEQDAPGPVSYYGLTKLEGEKAVAEYRGPWIIVRTAWMYGIRGRNFLKTVLGRAARPGAGPLRVVSDQYGSPTWAYRLALQIRKLLEGNHKGLYHATAEGHCTWHQLAGRFLAAMGVDCPVVPCATGEYPTAATRPKNSILENGRLKAEGISVMVDWRADLDEFVSTEREALLGESGSVRPAAGNEVSA